MSASKIHRILSISIASVWIANGLLCKLLQMVPRHEKIVARILGENYSHLMVLLIGLSEIFMAVWIISNRKSRLNAITQIVIVLVMNLLELIFAPDLLLWGRFNIIFAFLFVLVVYYNEFHLTKRLS